MTPAEPGSVLKSEGESIHDQELNHEEQKSYQSGTAILLHMMRWTRVETMNAVQDCSRYMKQARQSHLKALH